jgi:hypothetical protein
MLCVEMDFGFYNKMFVLHGVLFVFRAVQKPDFLHM